MAFLHLFIINKSGGLIYHRELSKYAPVIDVNILLSIGSTFHSLCSIAVEACPVKKQGGSLGRSTSMVGRRTSGGSASVSGGTVSGGAGAGSGGTDNSGMSTVGVKQEDGIEIIEGGGIILCCHQTLTGVKFVIT